MAEDLGGSVGDEFVLEEHSGESADDTVASGVELDSFQAKEIRQIFLTTLPDYLEPVSQMLKQVLSVAEGHQQARGALQTTLSSISTAAARVGINDVCDAIEVIRDHLLALEDEPQPDARTQRMLWDAFGALEEIAGSASRRGGGPSAQTIVSAMQHVQGIDKSVLERLTAAGLVTVDQLRIADPGEVVAVTGLDRPTVDRLLELLLKESADSAAQPESEAPRAPAPAEPSEDGNGRAEGAPAASVEAPAKLPVEAPNHDERELNAGAPSLPKGLEDKLRAQVEIEVSLDDLRAQILRTRLAIATAKERKKAAEHQRNRLESRLSDMRGRLGSKLSRLTSARLEQVKLERMRAEQKQALEDAARRIADLQRECEALDTERKQLADAISNLVRKIAQVKNALHAPEQEHSSPTAAAPPSRR